MNNLRFKKITGIILTMFSGLLIYTVFESTWTKTTIYNYPHKEIPREFNDFKIIFISDIHHGPYLSKERLKNLVQRVNNELPDLILLGGDFVHRSKKYINSCFDILGNLKSKKGIYAVLGNHDHREGKQETIFAMKKNGIIPIDNKALWIYQKKSRIKIGGAGDLWEDVQNIKPLIHDVAQSDFTILITHNPDYCEQINTDLIDLVLSGHSHGGQVTLFGLYAPILPSIMGQKYRYGKRNYNNFTSIITSGYGNITPPVRFFARPEIVVIKLISIQRAKK